MIHIPLWGWLILVPLSAVALFVISLPWIIRPGLRLLLATRYSRQITGADHIPRHGPALILSNHVSWADGFLLVAWLPRTVKVLVSATFTDHPGLRRIAPRARVIPVPLRGPRAQLAVIEAVRAAFNRGDAVLIFPEAQLTRNGLLGPFYRGLERMLDGFDHVPVIPVYMDNIWGSVWSHSGGRFFWKRPTGLRRTIRIACGPTVEPPVTAFSARSAVQATSVAAVRLAGPNPDTSTLPEMASLDLPHWQHPQYGLLAVSTPDFNSDLVRQQGSRPGTRGLPPPGIALRVVDHNGQTRGPDQPGSLQTLLPDGNGWRDTGCQGSLDRDGFVRLLDDRETLSPTPQA